MVFLDDTKVKKKKAFHVAQALRPNEMYTSKRKLTLIKNARNGA